MDIIRSIFRLEAYRNIVLGGVQELQWQSEQPRPIPSNSVESDHGCTSRIYFDNAGDNVALTLYNVDVDVSEIMLAQLQVWLQQKKKKKPPEMKFMFFQ